MGSVIHYMNDQFLLQPHRVLLNEIVGAHSYYPDYLSAKIGRDLQDYTAKCHDYPAPFAAPQYYQLAGDRPSLEGKQMEFEVNLRRLAPRWNP